MLYHSNMKKITKRLFVLLTLSIFTSPLLFAEGLTFNQKTPAGLVLEKFFGWDFGLTFKKFLANGFTVGFDYDQQFLAHAGWRARASANFFSTETKGLYCASASLTAYGIWFPLTTNMRKLYLSAGTDFDFADYFGPASNGGSIEANLTATSRIGWRFSLPFRFFLDAFVGYDYAWTFLKNSEENSQHYHPTGFQAGVKLSHAFKNKNQRAK